MAMDIGHESAAQGVEPVQKRRLLTVATVHADIPEVQPPALRRGDHLQCQRGLAAVVPGVLRDGGLRAAQRVVRPGLGQIQPGVHQAGHLPPAQGREHAHLAVVDLAQPAIPLPGDPGRPLALLGKAAFVDQQHRPRAAQQRVGLLGQLVAESVPIDRACGEHMLHRLMIDRVDFTHAQHVGPLRLEQPAQIAAKGRGGVAGARAEKPGKRLHMGAERRWQALKGNLQARGGSIFTTSS